MRDKNLDDKLVESFLKGLVKETKIVEESIKKTNLTIREFAFNLNDFIFNFNQTSLQAKKVRHYMRYIRMMERIRIRNGQ